MFSSKAPPAICAEVIRLLSEERNRLGMSKYELEQRAGVSQQMIGYVERGLRSPSFETVVRIAEGLTLDLGDVIKEAIRNVGNNTKRKRR